ncbi:MAG: hypothetical protein RIR70_1004 [Pseudomonadota bacterium]
MMRLSYCFVALVGFLAVLPASAQTHSESRKSERLAATSASEEEPQPEPRVSIKRSHKKSPNTAPIAAWEALVAGRLVEATEAYERTLAADPRNIDALLGLAHIAAQAQQPQRAQNLVQRALDAHPQHPGAQAMSLMLKGNGDVLASLSAYKTLLANPNPPASAHFALGTLYARDKRWGEAQEAFFKAWSAEPDNADYQYNLAVSLDHLNQPELAIEHYRGALHQASRREGTRLTFDGALVNARLVALSPSLPHLSHKEAK